jgi:hypothetical protein
LVKCGVFSTERLLHFRTFVKSVCRAGRDPQVALFWKDFLCQPNPVRAVLGVLEVIRVIRFGSWDPGQKRNRT